MTMYSDDGNLVHASKLCITAYHITTVSFSLFNSDATPVTAHHLDDTVSGLFSGMHKRSTRRRLPSTRQVGGLYHTICIW